MQTVKHKIFGTGEVIARESNENGTYITVRFENGRELKCGIPSSFIGAKIVLTSTWRVDWNKIPLLCGDFGKYLNQCLAMYDLAIFDKTPLISYLGDRRKEILTWLAHHRKEVESFVILDDMNYGWDKLNSRVVITNPQGYGLEEEHVQKALELLNKRIVIK